MRDKVQAQALLLAEMRSELAWTKARNEVLENALDRMNELDLSDRQWMPTDPRPGRHRAEEFSLDFDESHQSPHEYHGPSAISFR